ncbi:MAG TPA: hypothetical protein VFT13_09400, partial [Candidatus Krumholzibacteria bacterium]|nr:hypothetical protein [Candidatus Krumholzibacteria bacterium]
WQQDRDRVPLPGKVAGGVLNSHDLSRVVWVRREFTAGRYVLWCGMPILQTAEKADSAAAHATHDQAGMVKEFVVD